MSDFESPEHGLGAPSSHGAGQPSAASEPEGTAASAPGAAPPPRKSRGTMFVFGALTGCALIFGGVFLLIIFAVALGGDSAELSLATDKVAVVTIEGAIMESRDTLEALERYADNRTVKAIVIRINSPGGAIAPSQEIYSAIRRTRAESGKPIVASLDSVAASGGFYIAAACDRIVSNPGTITGSIGVILQWLEMKDLVTWAKLNPQTITSGELKDAGSPFNELTERERQYFQSIVNQLHGQFVRDVAKARAGKLTLDDVARVADGRVFTGEQALQLKLVDEIGSIDDAVRTAGKLAGIKGEPTRVWPKRREPRLLELLTGGEAEALIERIATRRVPQFLYRW